MQVEEEEQKKQETQITQNKQQSIIKQDSMIFDCLISMGFSNKDKHFANNFTGLPAIPIMGQYARGNYEFNDVKNIVACECFCDRQKGIVRNSETYEIINLPKNVKDIIFDIPYPIKHNCKEPDNNDNNNKNINNNQEKQQNQKKPKMEFNPLKFENAVHINFIINFSFQNSQIKHKFNNNQKQQQQEIDKKWLQMNLVCHPYIFQEIQFSGNNKRMIQNQPVCVVQVDNDSSILEFTQTQLNVKFNELRSEYMSCHMGKGMSLCFSPNNMKFYINQESYYQVFYSILLDDKNYHHVFLHINFMNRELEEGFKQAQNIQQIINYLDAMKNDKNQLQQLVDHLINLFQQ